MSAISTFICQLEFNAIALFVDVTPVALGLTFIALFVRNGFRKDR